MISIIDYGAGNIASVKNALDYLGFESEVISSPGEILAAEKIILPGVGSFGFMMESIRDKGLEEPIKEVVSQGKPFLGICLGQQVLFEKSEESPGVRGLGIFKGEVVRFRNGKVPQVGWNKVIPCKNDYSILPSDPGFLYFVNSYYVVPKDKSIISGLSDYYGAFCCAVSFKNITAFQFHPEKSGKEGLEMLRRWASC